VVHLDQGVVREGDAPVLALQDREAELQLRAQDEAPQTPVSLSSPTVCW
jgi:hypothetical protein